MIDWTTEYTLTSPAGTLLFNAATGSPYTSNSNYVYLFDEAACSETPGPLRITQDNVPQADGWIIHPSFLQGMQLALTVQLWTAMDPMSLTPDTLSPACDDDLCVMWDTLLLHIKALQNPSVTELFGNQCRINYTPACDLERMINRIQLTEWPVVTKDPKQATSVKFTLASQFPYEMNGAEEMPNHIADGSFEDLTNSGNTDMFAVYRVHGPFNTFTLTNFTTGLAIVYDQSLPGANPVAGGHYIEIDTFRNTVYLDGSGANYLAGVDMQQSDFFTLAPGTNRIIFGGTGGGSGGVDALWQSAWCN